MRICIMTSGHNALDDRIFYKEAISLKKKYNEVFLIAPDEKTEYNQNGISIIGVKKPNSLYQRFKLTNEIIDKAIDLKADIYHFHDFEMIYKVMKIKKHLKNSKIIYDVHEHYPDMLRMSKKVPAFLKPFIVYFVDKSETHIAKKFDYIITADDAVKDRFKNYNSNVDVIYNFSEFNIKDWENENKEYDAIYQGGITIERGAFNIVKAIEIVKSQKPSIKMIFVGPFDDANARDMVYKYIKDKKLSQNIQFTGKIPHKDVENYIRKSKMGIVTLLPLPKYYKNIPIKQFEYMSCGIPVIGSDLPPIKKFVTEYNSGIIVDPTKPAEIASTIIELLENPKRREELGKNGIRAVREAYNWDIMEHKLIDIYKKLDI